MKILLSAYACEPDKGSEPSVGWNWALALVRQGHEVHVLTRTNNQKSIAAELATQPLTFEPIYFDLPAWCRRWKHWPGGLYFYYLFWQIGAYRYARDIHRVRSFEIVHHITFVTFRQPSFMGGLGIPFLLGPVGGGETSPPELRKDLSLSGRLRESVRALLVQIATFDPLMRQTFRKASLIACTTEETRSKIPRQFQTKCMTLPAIGINVLPRDSSAHNANPSASPTLAPHFLFIGRLLYWKGLHLIFRAMPAVLAEVPDARLKVVGEGLDARWLRRIAEQCGVSKHVDWIDQMPHNEIAAAYSDHLAFVFPSLHDSGGLVVLESLAAGLPVICLALGGPGVFVDDSCGTVISPVGLSAHQVQQRIASAMIALAQQPHQRQRLAAHCVDRARSFSWDSAAQKLYARFENTSSQPDR